MAELQSPFGAVSGAQGDLFRKPGRCSKGLTHLQSFCKNVQVLAGGGMEAKVLLESVPLPPRMPCTSVSWPQASSEKTAVPTVKVSETLFTGSQGAVREAARQRVTMGTDPALSRQVQG